MKRICVLTDYYEPNVAYSLVRVAGNQIKQLLRAGYDPLVMVDEHFPDSGNPYPWDSVRLHRLPSIPRSNNIELLDGWRDHLEHMTDSMQEGLKGIDVVLTHDLIFQPAQITYNLASRQIAGERGNSLHWLHLIHSATSPGLINTTNEYLQVTRTPFPHSKIIFPNAYSRERIARNFGYDEKDVACVPHAIDYCDFFGFHPLTTKLVDDKRMLDAEFIGNYPVRLDNGKQVEHCIRVFAQMKKLGRSVRFVVFDFHSTAGPKLKYRDYLKELAVEQGLTDIELTFMSEFDESLKTQSPREMVRDLAILSNVFILPSRSETFSLVAAENFLAGCVGVLNRDFPAMFDIYGYDPLYAKWSSNVDAMTGFDGNTNVDYSPSIDHYCKDVALRIIAEVQTSRSLHLQTKLRMENNLDANFRRYLQPLLYSWDFEMGDRRITALPAG